MTTNENLDFWKRVVELQVFRSMSVPLALSEAKKEYPDKQIDIDVNKAYKRLKAFEVEEYRRKLQANIEKTENLLRTV